VFADVLLARIRPFIEILKKLVCMRRRSTASSLSHCYRDKDDVQLRTSRKQIIAQDKDEFTLKVRDMTTDKAGTYRCVARNDHGSAECKAQVTVVVGKIVEQQQH